MDQSPSSTGMKRLGMMGLEPGEELLGLERNSQVLVLCVTSKGSLRTYNPALNLPQVVAVSCRELVPAKAHGTIFQQNSASQI